MSIKKRWSIALISIFIFISSGYYFYWINTPMYAAGEIQRAIQTNDYELLLKHVDLEKVYTAALDDSIEVLLSEDTPDNKAIINIIKQLKKPLVKELTKQTESYFYHNKKTNALFEQPINTLTSYIGLTTLSITNFISVEEQNEYAILTIKLHDKNLNHDFNWKVKMEKDVNGTWCVVRILNLKEYIIERKTLLIKEYTE